MPRKQKDPIIDVMEYFETVSIDAAKLALVVVGGIVQRRASAPKSRASTKIVETTIPMRSRAEEAVEEPNPLDPKPKARTRRRPLGLSVEPVGGMLPGTVATVGE